MTIQAVANLNNEACSLISKGSCVDAIQFLNSALVTMKAEIRATESNCSYEKDDDGIETQLHFGSESSIWSNFTAMESHLFQLTAIMRTSSEPHHPFNRNCGTQERLPSFLPMQTIYVRPLMILLRHQDASVYELSMIITFNLALASHIAGIQMLTQPGIHDSDVLNDGEEQHVLVMHRKGLDALSQASKLYQLTLQILTANHTNLPENRLMYPIILNNLSHTHRILDEPIQATECDQGLLRALIELESTRNQSGFEVRDDTAASYAGFLNEQEVNPVLDALSENVWYLYEKMIFALSAPAA